MPQADVGDRYERVFAHFLRSLDVRFLRIDQHLRRQALDDGDLKQLDFVVAAGARTLLIDVKGRRVSTRRPAPENWITGDDVRSLETWQAQFGRDAEALLGFVYELPSAAETTRFRDHCAFDGRHYGFLAVPVDNYRRHMKVRSPRWGTVDLPRESFRRLARPLTCWVWQPQDAAAADPAEPSTR